jgi:uncharacterized cupin superfamily protein
MPSKGPIVLPSIATDDDLVAAPIDPADILEGSPQARSRFLGFIDDSAMTATIWETTAGRFNWHYGPDELVTIVEGEVEITPPDGPSYTLRRGDVMFVPGGQVLTFHVRDYMKKLAINAVETPPLRRLATQIPFAREVVRRLRAVRRRA